MGLAFLAGIGACGDGGTDPPAPPQPGGLRITVDGRGCLGQRLPIWLGYQDGEGPWRPIVLSGDTAVIALETGEGSLAWSSSVTTEVIVGAETLANRRFPVPCAGDAGNGGARFVQGFLRGLAPGTRATVVWRGGRQEIMGQSAFTLLGLGAGPQDLLVYLADGATRGPDDRIVIRPDLDPPNGGSLGFIDVDESASVPVVEAGLDIAGVPGSATAELRLARAPDGACTAPFTLLDVSGTTRVSLYGVSEGQLGPSDAHYLQLEVLAPPAAGGGTSSVVSGIGFGSMENRELRVPPFIPEPSVTSLVGPYLRARFDLIVPVEYTSSFLVNVSTPFSQNSITVLVPEARFDANRALSVEVPDLTTAGFDPAWAPPGQVGRYVVQASRAATGTASCGRGTSVDLATRTGPIP